MPKIFKIRPRVEKHTTNSVLYPYMEVMIETKRNTSDPLKYGFDEVKEAYVKRYDFDIDKEGCGPDDFAWGAL